jgi:hypothetical protein
MVNKRLEKQLKRKWYFMKTYRGLEHLHKTQWKWKNWKQVFLKSSTPIPPVHFPVGSGIPVTPITKVIKIGDKEDAECKTFYKKNCTRCNKPDVICIVAGDYLDSFMRYKQLKKCIKKAWKRKNVMENSSSKQQCFRPLHQQQCRIFNLGK